MLTTTHLGSSQNEGPVLRPQNKIAQHPYKADPRNYAGLVVYFVVLVVSMVAAYRFGSEVCLIFL